MGGRGAGSANGKRTSKKLGSPALIGDEPPLTVETVYFEPRAWSPGRYKGTVLEAIPHYEDGSIELVYATADSYRKLAKTNRTNYVTYTLESGFADGKPHNLNFDNIKIFKGKTYAVKEELKKRGYKFRDGVWVKSD